MNDEVTSSNFNLSNFTAGRIKTKPAPEQQLKKGEHVFFSESDSSSFEAAFEVWQQDSVTCTESSPLPSKQQGKTDSLITKMDNMIAMNLIIVLQSYNII